MKLRGLIALSNLSTSVTVWEEMFCTQKGERVFVTSQFPEGVPFEDKWLMSSSSEKRGRKDWISSAWSKVPLKGNCSVM